MPALAMLFQDRLDAEVTADALASQLRQDWPDVDFSGLVVDRDESADRDGPVCLDLDGRMIALLGVPAQVGDDVAEIAEHSRLWPNAEPAPVDYAAHTIVTVLRPGTGHDDAPHEDAIADAVLLSRVVASIVALTDTVRAVYFGSANHVVLPALFRDLMKDALPEPPLLAWVAMNVGQRPDGVMTGHTRGLDMLDLPDIEIPETPESAGDTFERLAGIVSYLVEQGPVIGDGDTIGSTEVAEIVVDHTPSAFDPERTVLRLRFDVDRPERKRRWFGRRR
ncbi:DUF4261 domain-containing protein [Prescottella agglutinans]|uniref:DUF4261 domain-containing protein n=1 Tax=Prescottella agglutinans TaxID=1644129 RepID=A0A3S3AYE2_9NOCA|nr:DUF4261 domain-containing protein [Prescottella agglutinans]RVW11489.1 DUF4261 domain-containing protein [Prescottella agglutinans]